MTTGAIDHSRAELLRQIGHLNLPDLKLFEDKVYYVFDKNVSINQEFKFQVEKAEVVFRKFSDGQEHSRGTHPWVPSFSPSLGVFHSESDAHPHPLPSKNEKSISGILKPQKHEGSDVPYQAKVSVWTTCDQFYADQIASLRTQLANLKP